ncbi:MAG: sn-glycerol-3-phosphate ABC transporter permease UgpA [Psychrobacter sp.]|nr:sn-glycerol-3-phosphate ABC transporter permease UgpA [Psychrobacter sp.]
MSRQVTFKQPFLPYLLLLPQLVITAVFFFWPAGQSIYSSFFREKAFGGSKNFVGLENYTALFADSSYYEAIGVTAVFAVGVTVVGMGLSLLLAVMADRVMRGTTIYRTVLIIPYAVAPAVIGTLFAFLLSPSVGIISVWLHQLGIHWNPRLDASDAMILVILTAVWNQISYNFLFFVAGLQSIPQSLIEAAAIDGAGAWRRFKDVVLPLLAPTTFFLFIINVVYAFFETFAIIDVTTKGGPGVATTTLVYKVYKTAFQSYDYGSSGAQSVILMGFIIVLTALQFKFIEKKIHY